jgi:hypothetical protein
MLRKDSSRLGKASRLSKDSSRLGKASKASKASMLRKDSSRHGKASKDSSSKVSKASRGVRRSKASKASKGSSDSIHGRINLYSGVSPYNRECKLRKDDKCSKLIRIASSLCSKLSKGDKCNNPSSRIARGLANRLVTVKIK